MSPEVGDPINAANGTCSYTATDLIIPGLGLPLSLARS